MSLQISNRAIALKPSASIAAKKMVSDLQAQGHKIVDLTIGEPDIPTPTHIVEAAVAAMKAGDTHYTSSAGTPALRAAIATHISREKGLPAKPENIAVGCGAKQLIFEVFSATLNEGDEVIVPAPYWVSYPDLATLHGGKPVVVICGEEVDFKLTPQALEAAISEKTRWLVLNTPNNPSGAIYSRDELSALGEVLQRHPSVWVMTDEIYEYLSYHDERAPSLIEIVPSLFDRAIIINGMSKAYAMTGWRIGYAAGPKALIEVVVKMLSQSTTCASSISQAAAVAALKGNQACVREATAMYRNRRDRMVEILSDAPGLSPRAPSGAFYLFISVANLIGRSTPAGKELRTDLDVSLYLLEQAKVAVLDGSAYGVSPYLRLSFAASMQVVESGSQAIVAAVKALR
ncbi:aminotransferase class I/II-fold pyridoxal phosphate-dependent enzyme [Rhizobium sp. SG570]|uniref:aminotransferase class I/II-fold pyridoxal phosphate-dependent enzyme n=1 Tax=Rhizobium sp. SG570 TaxID=2587113 RepID=UPI00119AF78B|nr:aminotransferase class I/II-fold pyridoxal phosphate-dependent enzyme [Rhizobium sp. SG570]NKJ39424.1 aspartate aminotransferase [Rhizobium sp. SG570]